MQFKDDALSLLRAPLLHTYSRLGDVSLTLAWRSRFGGRIMRIRGTRQRAGSERYAFHALVFGVQE